MTRTARRLEHPDWPWCVERVQIQANSLSARYYGCPVYLVGGALTSRNPRDVDLVIPIPNDLFVAMYGQPGDTNNPANVIERDFLGGFYLATPIWRRWARDCAKQGRLLTMQCERAVDFKTQPECQFDRYDKPRIRLDDELLDEFET